LNRSANINYPDGHGRCAAAAEILLEVHGDTHDRPAFAVCAHLHRRNSAWGHVWSKSSSVMIIQIWQCGERMKKKGSVPLFLPVNARLPGFYRPAKDWDLLVLVDKTLLATIEVKSQAGPSFGNNFNNRIEEALGNATDFWAAYQQGAFKPSSRPFLGYLMLLEEDKGSTAPVKERRQSQFPVFLEFMNTSYADRYRLFCRKVLRDRLYDAACLLLSNKASGKKGIYSEPDPELSFQNFALGLMAKATAYVKQKSS